MVTRADALAAAERLLVDFDRRQGYRWDANRGEYVSLWNGQTISGETVLHAVDTLNSQYVSDEVALITERLLDGRYDIATWQERMASTVKDAWIVNLRIGRGPDIGYPEYGAAGARLRQLYNQLNGFAFAISNGELTGRQISARAKLYALSAITAYWLGRQHAKRAAGFTHEIRLLNPAEHCDDCIGYAARGIQPIGTLPEPGEGSVCGANCKCEKKYFTADQIP